MMKIKYPILALLTGVLFLNNSSVKADFNDVPSNSEYYSSINALQSLNIVQGYSDGTFDQDREVSRAEFLKMALLAEMKTSKEFYNPMPKFPGVEAVKVNLNCFPDVKATDWFAPYICWAKDNKIVSGYPDGKFYPHQTVNVAEGAKIVARGDNQGIGGHWANGYFAKLAPYSLPESIQAPDQLLTRADTAEIIWRYYLASDKELRLKAARVLVWDGMKFLNLETIGDVHNYVVGYLYAKDGSGIYGMEYNNGDYVPKKVLGADPNSFKVQTVRFSQDQSDVSFNIATDLHSLYRNDESVPGSAGGVLSAFDNSSYSDPSAEIGYFYVKDQKHVYIFSCYEGCNLSLLIPESDADSFKPLEGGYAKDKNNVYYKGKILEEADPGTFEKIVFSADTTALCESPFSKDKNHVYLFNKILSEVDAGSFEMIQDYGFFFKDKNSVYKTIHEAKGSACAPTNAVKVENAELQTFKPLGSNYFLSQDKIYFINGIGKVLLTSANPESFEPYLIPKELNDPEKEYEFGPFGRDDQYVYYEGKALAGIDVATFHHLEPNVLNGQLYAWADKNRSYSWKDLNEMIGL